MIPIVLALSSSVDSRVSTLLCTVGDQGRAASSEGGYAL